MIFSEKKKRILCFLISVFLVIGMSFIRNEVYSYYSCDTANNVYQTINMISENSDYADICTENLVRSPYSSINSAKTNIRTMRTIMVITYIATILYFELYNLCYYSGNKHLKSKIRCLIENILHYIHDKDGKKRA